MNSGTNTRVGVILSAGGSAFAEAARIAASLPLEFHCLTDRPCGAEIRCKELSIPVTRIVEKDNNRFSRGAREHFSLGGVDVVLLHFSRLVSPELFQAIPCCNVHPSLLPAFPGIGAVKRAWSRGARFLGATLHVVDATVDLGPIIAQTVTPIPFNADLAWCERISFLQKTFMTLVLFELIAMGRLTATNSNHSFELRGLPGNTSANPTLTNGKLIDSFRALQSSLGFDILS